jgi:hypothetical protein
MKKLFYTLCFAVIGLSVSSCGTSSGSSTTTEITITGGQWAASGTAGQPNFAYVYSHTMSSISQSVVDNGYVLCYIKFTGTNTQYAPMPYTETYSGYTVNYYHQYQNGTLFIVRKDSDLNTIPPSGSITIKIVVVTTKDAPLLDGVNTNDYVQVKQALQLAD